MDETLIAWGRAVKTRGRFRDAPRVPSPVAALIPTRPTDPALRAVPTDPALPTVMAGLDPAIYAQTVRARLRAAGGRVGRCAGGRVNPGHDGTVPGCPQHSRRPLPQIPPLWLFTDFLRLPDPCAAAARLPRGLAGVVLRDDQHPARAALGQRLARICRARRLALVVAGDPRLAAALGAGVHLRGGRWPGCVRPHRGLVSSSAHSVPELRRARRAGADLVFLSPAFATASHPGAPALGPDRWARLAREAGMPVLALGGITGATVRRLPRRCPGAGAIGALT